MTVPSSRQEDAKSRLGAVMYLHRKRDQHGMSDGYCAECAYLWPCPTYHVANGWEYEDCWEDRWCSHMDVLMR